MSILLGPFDKNDAGKKAEDNNDELLMFGYACKLYRDDSKAILENSGQLLIPWMGDSSLMVDRYACYSCCRPWLSCFFFWSDMMCAIN